ncbi:hypothetical protein HD806DRAFT_488719 [Xylariaceae sp. AK1471]|nr:hypothetical protein HD806DRAFT_488719 [Xylariaceae sp. AK1471]
MASAPGTPRASADSENAMLDFGVSPTPTPTIQRLFSIQPGHDDSLGKHPMRAVASHQSTDDEKAMINHDQENVSPNKARHSRVLSGGLSPLKILAPLNGETRSLEKSSTLTSPRKWIPDKRFPVKVNTTPSPENPIVQHRDVTLEDAMVENKDLAQAVKIFEDEDTVMENSDEIGNVTYVSAGHVQYQVDDDDEQAGPDDTMVSTFSTFSAVPNMTMFDRIGHTPTKFANVGATSNSRLGLSPQRTSRPPALRDSGNTTNLLDFTEQIQSFTSRYAQQMSSLRTGSPGKSSANIIAATPKKRQPNLLDFDIPPLPTPRSIPTVTPRELESLKSDFLSQISGLKASLSGKEAEVLSLKTAVGDAEKRVGECMEELREVKAIKETLAEEREGWEKRGKEMESVLRKVKEEIVHNQREREELESKLEEGEKRREAAEIMAQEAESKIAAMRAGKANADSTSDASNKSPEKNKAPGSREVEIAVEKVSRELHSLYKSKHESKIAALKKSYENRWSKKIYELETKIEELSEENEKLRVGRDATMTKVDANQSMIDDERNERKTQAVKDSTHIKELNAEIEKLGAVITSVKSDNQELRQLLEQERLEKGELVQLAEEMMAMQSLCKTETPPPPPPAVKPQPTTTDDFRSSVGRPSGLRAPGSVKKPTASRIGGLANERKIGGGLPRPGSGMGSRSGIMSSIEKMGNYRGRGD